jgi:NAD(P)-dependent dehydrogenase (short-subunit alcohol dehydrogenase family)
MDVKGKVAFVTGGASGIGLGMARAFVRAGMTVMIADVREDHLASALSSFSNSEKVRGLKLDVTDRSAMARAVEETLRAFGKVHVLCNNAGVGLAGPMKLATYADWDWVMGVNLGGVINGVVAFLPHMLAQREGGHIVNTCSMSGILPHAGAGIYTTSKAAVIGMSEVLRTELAEENIGVSAFCPGPVQTKIAQSGKTRPAHLAETGYAEFDKAREGRSVSPLYMEPLRVGERVLEGVRRNELFIFTHSEFRDGVRERCEAIMAAIPNLPENPEFKALVPFLLRNPIYTEGRKK